MKKILLFIFVLMFVPFVYSAPPVTTVSQFPNGYYIIEQELTSVKINTDYKYNFFVHNSSNGILITNTSINCTYFLAYNNGSVLYSTGGIYDSTGYWYVIIGKGNISQKGEYPYGLQCASATLGGSLSGVMYVTTLGWDIQTAPAIIYFILTLGCFVFFFLTLYGAIKINWNSNSMIRYFKPLLMYFTYLELLLLSALFYGISNNYLYSGIITSFFYIIYRIFLACLIPLTPLIVLYLVISIVNNAKLNKAITRGVPYRK